MYVYLFLLRTMWILASLSSDFYDIRPFFEYTHTNCYFSCGLPGLKADLAGRLKQFLIDQVGKLLFFIT